MIALLFALGCGPPAYVVEGTVVRVEEHLVVIDHEAIRGFMGPMVMPFELADPASTPPLAPGDRVVARMVVDGPSTKLVRVRVTGRGPPPEPLTPGPEPLRVGETLPATALTLADGSASTIGAGQGIATAVAFLYTRCADPAFCPATVAKLQALQGALAEAPFPARIVAVTVDPDHDTPEVLARFAADVGADPARWSFGVTDALGSLARRAGLDVTRTARGEVVHGLRLLVLDRDGILVARYDDNRWEPPEVVAHLGR